MGQSYYESISLPIINYQQQHKHVYLLAYRNYNILTVTCLYHWPKNKILNLEQLEQADEMSWIKDVICNDIIKYSEDLIEKKYSNNINEQFYQLPI